MKLVIRQLNFYKSNVIFVVPYSQYKIGQNQRMNEEIRPVLFGLKLGVIAFPFFFILDYFIYPEYRLFLLMSRLGVSIFLAVTAFVINRADPKYYYLIIFISMVLISTSISLMCFVTKDGFASSYYSGLLQIIVVTTLLFNVHPLRFVMIILTIVLLHFIILAQVPWVFEDLLINIFAIGGISILAILVHRFIFHLAKENKSLKGLLPICANCKKVRDDKGYWNRIESYIEKHSDAEFSHGICPECLDKLYGDEKWYKRSKMSE